MGKNRKVCNVCNVDKDIGDFNKDSSRKGGRRNTCRLCTAIKRENNAKVGIYKITSPSGKVYVGQSKNIEQRFRSYKSVSSNRRDKNKINNSILKYGWNLHLFEIIEECPIEELNCRERYWQDFYDVIGKNGLNCVLQDCNDIYRVVSEETKKRMSDSMSGEKHRQWGVPIGEYQKDRIREVNSKVVLDLKTGIFYNSAKEASEYFDIKYSTLRCYLNGSYPNKTSLIYC